MIDKFRHIIWDWNGTLFNDVNLSIDLINNILTCMELKPLSPYGYKNIFTFPIKEYYAKAGIDFNKYSFEKLGRQWIVEYEKRRLECRLYDGAKDVLQFIYGKGIEQSILSAYSQDNLVEIVSHFGLNNFFSHLVGLDNIYATSKIELGIDFMKRIGNDKEEVLLIGDTVHDYEVACEIGAECILIADGHQNKEILSSCNVPVLNNIRDIYNF
jgi:phosphoglycolate phosphatase